MSLNQRAWIHACYIWKYSLLFLVILQRSNYTVQSSLSTKTMMGRERKSDEVGMQTVWIFFWKKNIHFLKSWCLELTIVTGPSCQEPYMWYLSMTAVTYTLYLAWQNICSERQKLPRILIAWGRLKISRWPFHSCTIFEAYLINSLRFSEVSFFPFHSPG